MQNKRHMVKVSLEDDKIHYTTNLGIIYDFMRQEFASPQPTSQYQISNYMVRCEKSHVVNSPKISENNRDLTFEPSSDLNSDLADSSIGFNPRSLGRTRYSNTKPISRLNGPYNITKRDFNQKKLE